MALFEEHAWVDTDTFILNLKNFAESNGWTIDNYVAGSVYMSKGGGSFRVWYASTVAVNLQGGTGYSGGTLVNPSPILTTSSLSNGSPSPYHRFYSAGNSIYFMYRYSTLDCFCSLVNISEKVGNWTGGIGLSGGPTYGSLFTVDSRYGIIFRNGAWTPNSALGSAGGVIGLSDNTNKGNMSPTDFSLATLPARIPLFVRNLTNTTLLHPIGFLPNIYICNPGLLYDLNEQIMINGIPYIWAYSYTGTVWHLIKLEI